MASTNKTTNYELSQFLGTDKPAWLSDYNTDMSKIDAQMKLNADAATAAGSAATTASTAIGTLTDLTTEAKTTIVAAINEVDSNADTAQATATNAGTAAATANTNLAKFNLVNKSSLTPTPSAGTSGSVTNAQFATDTTSSIFKVYGRIRIENLNNHTGSLTLKVGDTSLRPANAYEINAGAIVSIYNTDNTLRSIGSRNIKVNTDGSIYVVMPTQSVLFDSIAGVSIVDVQIPPCLYFNTDFGDA